MNRNLLWRGLLIFAVVAIALFAGLPLNEKLNLGLDLQGGIHLVLQVEDTESRQKLRPTADLVVLATGMVPSTAHVGMPALRKCIPSVPPDSM